MNRAEPSPPLRRTLVLPIVCIWALTTMTFSMPGRDGPSSADSLDVIALAKLAVRFLSLGCLGFAVMRLWDTPRLRAVLTLLLPFWVFLGWAFVSAGWSALPSVSVGQSIGLTVMLLLSTVIGAGWQDEADTSRLLRHLSLALLVVGGTVITVDLVNHDISGLNRDEHVEEGASGIVHPTSAGATASLGLVVLLASRLLWGWGWTRHLLPPTLPVMSYLLVLANSRMALGMAVLGVGLIVLWFSPVRALAAGVLLACLAGLVYVTLDPDLALVESALKRTEAHVSRGESAESLTSLTGRTALWEAIGQECLRSPLLGHGYFVTSHNGLLDVWSGPANRSAHNVLLQVQVTTGLVGTGLFLWALGRIGRGVLASAAGRSDRLHGFLTVLAIWYAGWGQLCESFMGPVQPETVVFYTVLGLALGLASRHVVAARPPDRVGAYPQPRRGEKEAVPA